MKKLIKYALLGLGLFLVHEKIALASSDFVLEEDPNHVTYKIEKPEKTVRLYFYLVKDKVTGELVYCLEPGVQLSDQTYEELEEWEFAKVHLTEEKKNEISKIAYYGYYYPGHNTLSYYYAAQLLIWEKIVPENWRIYYTEYLGGNEFKEAFAPERNEILRLLEQDEKRPSIAEKSFTWNSKEKLVLTDHNQKLSEYQITSKTNFEITKESNTLEIKGNGNLEETITFQKDYTGNPIKFYLREDGQNVMRTGRLASKTFSLHLSTYSLALEVHKSGENKEALAGVTFELSAKENIKDKNGKVIYPKNALIETKTTPADGIVKFTNLYDGKYVLKETNAPLNYVLETKLFDITLNKQNPKQVIQVENKKKKQSLIIQKIDSETKNPLSQIHFKIYNEQAKCIFDGVTEENGMIKLDNLDLGKYKIVEIETQDGYELLKEPIWITLEGNETSKTVSVENTKKKQSLLLKKQDSEDGTVLKGVHFQIWNEKEECIFDGFTNEEGTIELESLPLGTYKIIEIETILGYELEKNPVFFTLNGEEKELVVTITNHKIEEVPNTAEYRVWKSMPIYLEERKKKHEKNHS